MFRAYARKALLTAHVASSVGAVGAIASYIPLAITAVLLSSQDRIRAAFVAMEIVADYSIAPLLTLSLCSGIVQAIGTPWGLFRHYWVVVKLIVTVLAIAVLFARLPLVHHGAVLAMGAAVTDTSELRLIGLQLLVHSSVGLFVLVGPLLLSIYKPKGLTRYGFRKRLQSDSRLATSEPNDHGRPE